MARFAASLTVRRVHHTTPPSRPAWEGQAAAEVGAGLFQRVLTASPDLNPRATEGEDLHRATRNDRPGYLLDEVHIVEVAVEKVPTAAAVPSGEIQDLALDPLHAQRPSRP